MGPLLDKIENNPENSQNNYTNSCRKNILPITLTSYFQCNHSLTGVLPQIATNSTENPSPSGKPSKRYYYKNKNNAKQR